MFEMKCNVCEFTATGKLPFKSDKCPCCESKNSIITNRKNTKKNNLPNFIKDTFSIELEGKKLNFKLLNLEEELEVEEFSKTLENKLLKNGVIYTVETLEEIKYTIAYFAKALHVKNMNFLDKVQYINSNMSKEHLDLLNMKYSNYVQEKFSESLEIEIDKMIDTASILADKLSMLNMLKTEISELKNPSKQTSESNENVKKAVNIIEDNEIDDEF